MTEWFPLNTKGKLKLSIFVSLLFFFFFLSSFFLLLILVIFDDLVAISLSPPALAPFKFVYNYVNAAREWFILGPNDET